MTEFNEEYYIAIEVESPVYPTLIPQASTADRPYGRKELGNGPPLMFFDGFKDEYIASGIKETVCDVLFEGSDLIVSSKLKEEIEQYNIDNLQFYPVIYKGNDGTWYDSFWFLNFYKDWGCWDRALSVYKSFDESDPYDYAKVKKYSLDQKVISSVVEEKRLMFKIGRSMEQYIFIHKKIAKLLLLHQIPSLRLFKVSDFIEGMQY